MCAYSLSSLTPLTSSFHPQKQSQSSSFHSSKKISIYLKSIWCESDKSARVMLSLMKEGNIKAKLIFAVSIFFLFSFICANAQVVAVSCIESVHTEKMPSEITLYFENELLSSLFDNGMIVTSLPYMKENIEDFKKRTLRSLQLEEGIDFVALIYFKYEESKRYDEFRRKNLLPCIQILCRMMNVKTGVEIDSCDFSFSEIEGKVMFTKVDFCLSKIKELILKSIRRKV